MGCYPDHQSPTSSSPITPSEVGEVVRRVLLPVLPGGEREGVVVNLTLWTMHEHGTPGLRRQIGLLGSDAEVLVCGFYVGSGDSDIQRDLQGYPYLGRTTVRPDTELDWDLWGCDRSAFDLLERDLIFPDLVISTARHWMIWSEDNDSFLLPIPAGDLHAA